MSSDGSTVAIGAYGNDNNGEYSGHVRIYGRESGGVVWTQIGEDISGEAAGDAKAHSVASSAVSLSNDGTVVAIGSPNNANNGYSSGHVRVFRFKGSAWTQIGDNIDGEGVEDDFGFSVSLSADGTHVAIGAPQAVKDGDSGGYVQVFQLVGGSWLKIGQTIFGEAKGDDSGYSVSLSADGRTVAIGAPYNDSPDSSIAGHARVYQLLDKEWIQLGNDIDGNDQSGSAVSLSRDGSTVAIGAKFNDDNGYWSGHVKVFRLAGGTWSQVGLDINGESISDKSGESVSLSENGDILAIGAAHNDGVNGSNSGHVRVYGLVNRSWLQVGDDIDGESASDLSGESISLSADGTILAIGARKNHGSGRNFRTCSSISTNLSRRNAQ